MISDNCKKIKVTDGVGGVISTSDCTYDYYIYGTEALTGNWSITVSGTPTYGFMFRAYYNASVTLGGNHIFIVGTQMPDHLVQKDCVIHGFYDGTSWLVIFNDDRQDTGTIDTADIVNKAIINDKLADVTRGFIKAGDATNRPADIDARAAGAVIVGDGTDVGSKVMSGDATINGAGALTIANNAVTNAKLAALNRGHIKIGNAANVPVDLNIALNGGILIGDGTDSIVRTITGDATVSSLGLLTLAIPAMWEPGSAGLESCTRINANTGCDATGDYAVAEGNNTLASGLNSHAEGQNTVASGSSSHAEGNSTTASAPRAHAEGSATTASGQFSHAEGQNTVASNTAAHAEGNGTTASGIYSHSEGHNTLASSDSSHAEGNATISKSIATHAEGDRSVAPYYASSALGWNSFIATGDCQRVLAGLSKVTTDALPHYLTDATGATGLTIPTDCTAKVKVQVTAVQVGGVAGTIGDSFSQEIWFTVKDIAGALTMETTTRATTAGICTVAADVTYFDADKTAAFGGTVVPDLIGNELRIEVNGEANKDINWSCLIELIWIGYRNFIV